MNHNLSQHECINFLNFKVNEEYVDIMRSWTKIVIFYIYTPFPYYFHLISY